MATTTNYGWDTPDDTDLVKDGALAMRDLGQDIDTSMQAALLGKRSGLTPIATSTFSGSSGVIFDNIFTSDYRNYYVTFDGSGSSNVNLQGALRTSGGADAAGTYSWMLFYPSGGSVLNATGNGITPFYFGVIKTTYGYCDGTIFAPLVSGYTVIKNTFSGLSGTTMEHGFFSNVHSSSSLQAYGVRFYPSSGTMTGTITVYGLRNFS